MGGDWIVGTVNRFGGNVGRLVRQILRLDGAHGGKLLGLPLLDMLGPILIEGGVKVAGNKIQLDLSGLLLSSFAIDGGVGDPQAEVVSLSLPAEDEL